MPDLLTEKLKSDLEHDRTHARGPIRFRTDALRLEAVYTVMLDSAGEVVECDYEWGELVDDTTGRRVPVALSSISGQAAASLIVKQHVEEGGSA